MHRWSYVRRQARARRREVCAHACSGAADLDADTLDAAALLGAATAMTGVARYPLTANDPLLYGAQATLDDGAIFYNADAEAWLVLFYQAHEFAHYWLHDQISLCADEAIDPAETEDRARYGVERVEAYGPQQRRETEANVFAREFLMPGDVLRRLFVEENRDAEWIAARSGLALDFVLHALAHALLTPDAGASYVGHSHGETSHTESCLVPDDLAVATAPAFALDASQRRAAESAHTPLLVVAGPGTGKTRALVGRILHLLESGVTPASILALTFSNKAAEELRARVETHAPVVRSHIEINTFHSFGLEILRRHWREAGLSARPRVLDPTDALFILESRLAELDLDHYQNLYEPTANLPAILAAISRAKDELCSPARYTELARRMHEQARDANDREAMRRAEQASEVARVYTIYQAHLEAERMIDFGDLVARVVRLMRDNEAVRSEVQRRYAHVLVDEYQDVNRACGVLLKLLAPEGKGLWFVGDTRQAIYRWRGAAPAQVRYFRRDFPAGQVAPLELNYRSRPAVVGVFSAFAERMRAASISDDSAAHDFTAWCAFRDDEASDEPAVSFEVAENPDGEARHLARIIKERKSAGALFHTQAVICRTHTQLARIARTLEAEGVPALYSGDIFERGEVRDLLSLLALACDRQGRTLVRVARFDEYRIPLRDVRLIFARARETDSSVAETLAAAIGDDAAARLAHHLARISETSSPWRALARYLFIDSRYLTPLLADGTVAGAQKRLAIHQLLQFAHAETDRAVHATGERDARLALLRYVRRLKSVSADRALRRAPAAAEALDAVSLVTVHNSKGLEWDHVYLPNLGRGRFPNRRKFEMCPPPAGMVESPAGDSDELKDGYGNDARDTHLEEEECLFFVALSRARETLCLSRASAYGKKTSKASEFLDHIAAHLPRAANAAPRLHDDDRSFTTRAAPGGTASTTPHAVSHVKPLFGERQLANHLKCPRKYFYENVLYTSGKGEEAIYLRFHTCVHDVLRRFAADAAPQHRTNVDAALNVAHGILVDLWRERGIVGHVHEPLYRERARLMVERGVRRILDSRGTILEREWTITRPRALITVAPDHVELIGDAGTPVLVLRHTRTGRAPAKAPDDPLYALYYALAAEHFPHARTRVEVLYLAIDDTIELDLQPHTVAARLRHYDDAIDSILAKNFTQTPSDQLCPRCAHLFTCPITGEED